MEHIRSYNHYFNADNHGPTILGLILRKGDNMELRKILKTIAREFKGKSMGNKHQCLYLDYDGNKCVIGCFIPDGHSGQDSLYDVHNLLEYYPDLRDKMPSQDMAKLEDFQKVHDRLSDTATPLVQKLEVFKAAKLIFG